MPKRPCRPARPTTTKLRKTAAPSGGGFTPIAFFGRPCRQEAGTSVKNKRSPHRMFLQVLSIWDAPRKSGTAQSEALPSLFSRNPRTARCCVDLAPSRRIPNCSVPVVWTKTPGDLKHHTEYEQIGILSSCVSIQATRQCHPPCRRECNPSKSERAGGRLLACCWELLRIRSSPSRATGVRPYKKCAVSSLPWPLNTVLAVFPRIEAVDPPGYRIHRDPPAGAVPIRRMVNVTHPPRTAHSGPRADSACLTVVPLRDHVQINRIPRDS